MWKGGIALTQDTKEKLQENKAQHEALEEGLCQCHYTANHRTAWVI